jgi:hypothetical protein
VAINSKLDQCIPLVLRQEVLVHPFDNLVDRALQGELLACDTQKGAKLVYRAVVHQRLNDMGKQRGDIVLPDLGLVARDFQSHPNLDIPKLSHKLVPLRVLTQPSVKGSRQKWKALVIRSRAY